MTIDLPPTRSCDPALLGEALRFVMQLRMDVSFLVGKRCGIFACSPRGAQALDRHPGLRSIVEGFARDADGRDHLDPPELPLQLRRTPCTPRGQGEGWLVVADHRATELTRPLTPRQAELVDLLDTGMTNAEIAEAMGIARSTVKTMLERLYARAGVHSRVALLNWAHEPGS